MGRIGVEEGRETHDTADVFIALIDDDIIILQILLGEVQEVDTADARS